MPGSRSGSSGRGCSRSCWSWITWLWS